MAVEIQNERLLKAPIEEKVEFHEKWNTLVVNRRVADEILGKFCDRETHFF